MPRVAIRDIDVNFERHGERYDDRSGERGGAPPILFIGGSGGDLRQKPGVGEGPLPRAFDVLAYDQRGLGQTDIPDGPYTMADYGEDAAALLDAVGWDRCAVMGVSFGGMVAQELAVRHPQRVERLVLACTSSGGRGGSSYPLHELSGLPAEDRIAKSLELSDTRLNARWREENPEAWERAASIYSARQTTGAGEPRRELGQRLQLEARAGHDTFDRLPALGMPVYLCAGRYDGIAPPSNMAALEKQIPDARLELFEGGHLFLMQDREAWPRILDFLTV